MSRVDPVRLTGIKIQPLTRPFLRALFSLECSSALLPSLEGCRLQHLPTCCLTVSAVKWSKEAVSSSTWMPACTQPCRCCFVCYRWASQIVSPPTRCVGLAPYMTELYWTDLSDRQLTRHSWYSVSVRQCHQSRFSPDWKRSRLIQHITLGKGIS